MSGMFLGLGPRDKSDEVQALRKIFTVYKDLATNQCNILSEVVDSLLRAWVTKGQNRFLLWDTSRDCWLPISMFFFHLSPKKPHCTLQLFPVQRILPPPLQLGKDMG